MDIYTLPLIVMGLFSLAFLCLVALVLETLAWPVILHFGRCKLMRRIRERWAARRTPPAPKRNPVPADESGVRDFA